MSEWQKRLKNLGNVAKELRDCDVAILDPAYMAAMGDDVDAAASLIEELAKAQEWQPIATAPKDADAILIFREGWGVQSGWYDGGIKRWVAGETHGLTGGTFGDDEPTHWKPLPSPPTT